MQGFVSSPGTKECVRYGGTVTGTSRAMAKCCARGECVNLGLQASVALGEESEVVLYELA
jgi:hypothetical protein